MRSTKPSFIAAVVVLVVIAAAWFVRTNQSVRREEAQIRTRYQQMRDALTSGDTNTARSLFAPNYRWGAHHSFDKLNNFAQPLGSQSSIGFSNSEAGVNPVRIFHYGILPGGHTIKMVKIDGDWFFTGEVSID